MTTVFENYQMEDTVSAELNNNLTIVNAIIGEKGLRVKPEFYILGGAAMVFHALNYKATLDIDTANKISADIKKDIELFIDDAASEVSILPRNYKDRAVPTRIDLEFIQVFILSKEDLLINKLLAGRRKDIAAIKSTMLLYKVNRALVSRIISEELLASDRRALYVTSLNNNLII